MRQFRILAYLTAILMLATAVVGCSPTTKPSDLTSITVWHYYNGIQKQIFDQLVSEFNDTAGQEKGIVVKAYNQGSVNDLIQKVLDALSGNVGSPDVPDIFAAYADTAYDVYSMGLSADLSQYLSEEERAAYVPAYLSEGEFNLSGELTLLPVAKSTEFMMLNETDWAPFAAATGASETAFETWEGIAQVAKEYYEWTDSLTPEMENDGRAFFGRDVMANYQIIGSLQLGAELFAVENGDVTIQLDRDSFKRMWDAHYIPYINGYFASVGRFRSDDAKTGEIIALVGSTTGAIFFPQEVTLDDGTSYPINVRCFKLPNFAGTKKCGVQQGAGMAVTRSTPEREAAAMEFLKWFTDPAQNLKYCIETGYLPVEASANNMERIRAAVADAGDSITPVMQEALLLGGEIVSSYRLYTNKAFENGNSARQILESFMQERAEADRGAVIALMEGGMTKEEAVAPYSTDEYFDAWFSDFSQALHKAVAR